MPLILILDQNAQRASWLSELVLSIEPHIKIELFQKAEAALAWLHWHGADMIIADSRLQGVEDHVLIHRLRDLPRGRDLPLLMLTGRDDSETRQRVLEAGLVQSVAVDVKGPWAMYPDLTGQGLAADVARAALAEVFALARTYPGRVYFRCTKVPDLTAEDLETTRAQVPGDLPLRFQDYVEPRSSDDLV